MKAYAIVTRGLIKYVTTACGLEMRKSNLPLPGSVRDMRQREELERSVLWTCIVSRPHTSLMEAYRRTTQAQIRPLDEQRHDA